MSPAACGARLAELFPALFRGAPKPLKLRIQSDIQQRAPGVFTKQALSAFFRRYTGSTGYLQALVRSTQRYDLDGAPAGELSEEHRRGADEELQRRRGLQQARRDVEQAQRQLEETERRQRAQLLRDFERTALTPANFCALKGIVPDALEGLLAQAREEARHAPAPLPLRERGYASGHESRPAGDPGRGPRGHGHAQGRGQGHAHGQSRGAIPGQGQGRGQGQGPAQGQRDRGAHERRGSPADVRRGDERERGHGRPGGEAGRGPRPDRVGHESGGQGPRPLAASSPLPPSAPDSESLASAPAPAAVASSGAPEPTVAANPAPAAGAPAPAVARPAAPRRDEPRRGPSAGRPKGPRGHGPRPPPGNRR